MNNKTMLIGKETIVINDQVAEAIAEIQEDDENVMLDGIDLLMSFIIGSGIDDHEAIGHLSTLNMLRRCVRKISQGVIQEGSVKP